MARYPGTLESANTNEFGIVFADHIQGHKTVANLNALYNISDAILSKSKTNAGNDAIGQEWYVVSEGYYYRLDNWANRRQASGWRKLQNTDEEFDSLQNHGADKIKSFTTTNSTVSLNFNTWKNSTTSTDGSVTIPAATGDQAGVLTANGKDQLTQLNKIGELTHLTDDGVFTEEASTVTIHYSCINTKEGATSEVVTKSEAIPEATLTNAGVLSAAKRNQLEQLDKLGEVTHLTDGGVFTTDANTATIHYQCIDTNSGANSAVSTKTANIPAATLTNAGVLDAAHRNQLEQLDKLGEVTHLTDDGVFTTDANTVTLHYQCIDTDAGANSAVSTKTAVIPEATLTNAGTLASSNRNQLEQLNKIEKTSFLHHTSDNSSATFTSTGSAVTLHWDTIDTTDGANSEVTERSANIPVASSTSAGTMSSTDKIEHDRISTVNFELGAVTPSSTTVQIAANKTNITDGSDVTNNITLSAVTSSAAGVMTAADKVKLDTTIPNYTVNTHKISSNPVLNSGDIKMDDYVEATGTSEAELSIKTTDTVGIAMGKLQKQQLDNEEVVATALAKLNTSCGFDTNGNYSPSGPSTSSSTSLADAILDLDNTLNSNKSTIDNYTVNGLKISTNPVLDGADVKITGYSQPSSSSALTSSDTINAALGKLEKGLNNEISNRTTAVNNLRSEINNNINTKLDELEQQINENIDTRLTEVESEINNTITPQINNINSTISNLDIFSDISTDSGTASATTNNDSITISGGTNISTSGSGKTVTITLNSTISLTRVNASSGFYQQSDERLESNIKPLEHTLEDICSIPTDSFILNGKQDLGTIAQDVEKIIPEVVCECEVKAAEIPNPENFTKVEKDGETYVLVKEVDYAKLSILALEGVKLLKAEIDKLKEELALRENK